MRQCETCGAELDAGSRFCGECGATVRAQTRELALDRGAKAKSATPTKVGKGKELRETQPMKGKTLRGTAQGVAEAKPDPKDMRSTLRGVAEGPIAVARPAASAPSPPAVKPAPAGAGATERPPPGASEPPPMVEGAGEFQRLLDEVESGFDAILVTGDDPAGARSADADDDRTPTAENVFDQSQARQLFHDLVIANAQPIRDFMIEVRLGEPHAAWIPHAMPAIRAILRSAEGMGFHELADKARGYIAALERAAEPSAEDKAATTVFAQVIRGEVRERIIDAYSELIAFFPQAFGLEAEANKREAAIVHALLSKVPGLYKLGLDRIYATGMASLGLFYVSRPKEIAELGGVSLEVAERIVERFSEHRSSVSESSPAKSRQDERQRLRDAVAALSRSCRAYDASAPVSQERKVHRRERLLNLAEVALLMARLGEVDRMKSLEPLSFAAKVEQLNAFLEEAERRALAEQGAR